MPKAAPSHRANLTLTMTGDLAAKIDRVVNATNSTKNALICGVLASTSEEDLARAYNTAVQQGKMPAAVEKDDLGPGQGRRKDRRAADGVFGDRRSIRLTAWTHSSVGRAANS